MQTQRYYEQIAGTLSKPSKMPGYGYGLPALKSCATGSKLAKVPGTSCSKCYACKGRYMFPNVVEAQERRMKAIDNPLWVEAMVGLIRAKKQKYFRWHDSGDIISLDHLSKIVQIAQQIPDCIFWLPTQEHKLVSKYRTEIGDLPYNLTVRLSTPKIDGRPVTTDLCTSSVYKNEAPQGYVCPAPNQGNQCGTCRACWTKEIKNVCYKAH